MNDGDEYLANGDIDRASAAYGAAAALLPGSHETLFWHAVTLVEGGRVDEALPLFARAFEMWPLWRELVERLPDAGLLPHDPDLMQKIVTAR